MSSTSRIDDMLSAQQAPVDPFAKAQSMQAQQSAMPGTPMQSDGLAQQMQLPGTQSQPQATAPAPNAQPSTGSGLFQAGGPKAIAQFDASKLPQALRGMGIDPQGLAMNQLGRVQLMGRLRNKYGNDYLSNPDAMKALGLFDENSKQNPQSMDKTLANGQRTLQALLGGKT